MLRQGLVAFSLFTLACAPADDIAPPGGTDGGPGGSAVAMGITLDVSNTLDVVSLTIETESVDLLSDREPDQAARLAVNGSLALETPVTDMVASAPPGAYSAMVLSPGEGSAVLALTVRIAGVRIRVEASSLPAIRVRCPVPVDVADGATLAVQATLNLDALESTLTGSLFPPPLGVTELFVTDESDPPLVEALVDALVSSWTLTCSLE